MFSRIHVAINDLWDVHFIFFNKNVITNTFLADIQRILTKSRDYNELTHVWKAWRDAAGKPIREKYLRFVNLSNEAARLNGKF